MSIKKPVNFDYQKIKKQMENKNSREMIEESIENLNRSIKVLSHSLYDMVTRINWIELNEDKLRITRDKIDEMTWSMKRISKTIEQVKDTSVESFSDDLDNMHFESHIEDEDKI